MSPQPRIPASILVALGVSTGCPGGQVGPCLDFPVETGDTGDTGDTADGETSQAILERGVLPKDVEERLRARKANG